MKHSGGEYKFFNTSALSKNLPTSEKYRHALGPNHWDHREITHALETTQNPCDEPMQIVEEMPEELAAPCYAPTENLNCLIAYLLRAWERHITPNPSHKRIF